MSENGHQAQEPAKRLIRIDPHFDEETGTYYPDTERLHDVVTKLLGTLDVVGGVVNVAADRVIVSEPGEPFEAVTVGYVVQWQAYSPARRVSNEEAPAPAPVPEPEEAEAA